MIFETPSEKQPSENKVLPSSGGQLPSYEDDHEPPRGWRRHLLNWKLAVALAAVIAVAALFIWGPSIYREAKVQRALHILEDGERHFREGDMTAAGESFRKAFSLAPGDERIVRIITRYNAEQGDPGSVQEIQKRFDNGSASTEEILVLATCSLRQRNLTQAGTAIQALPGKLPPPQEIRRQTLHAQFLAMDNRHKEAIAALRSATKDFPGENGNLLRLFLGELLLTLPENRVEGASLLSELGNDPGEEGRQALNLLARYNFSAGNAAEIPNDLADRLRAHPKKTYIDDLLAAELDMAKPDANRPAIIEGLVKKARDGKKEEWLALARWMIRKGAFSQVTELVTPEKVREHNDALFVCLDALAGQGLWKEIRTMLSGDNAPDMDNAIRHLFLARVATELGDPDEASRERYEVRRYLRLSPPQTMRYVALYSEKTGQIEEARHAYRLLADRSETAAEGYLGLLRCQPANASAAQTLELYDRLLTSKPDMPEASGDRAYLALLLGQDVDASAATAKDLHNKHPQMLSFLSIAALASLRLNDPFAAAELYNGRQIDWKTSPDIWKVVRVAVLRANGDSLQADELEDTIRKQNLRPEELDLLHPKP